MTSSSWFIRYSLAKCRFQSPPEGGRRKLAVKPLFAGRSHLVSQPIVRDQARDRVCERLRIVWQRQISCFAVVDNFGNTAGPDSDARLGVIHCFEKHDATPFLEAWQDEYVCVLVIGWQQLLGHSSGKDDFILRAKIPSHIFEGMLVGAIAYDNTRGVGRLRR